MTSTEKSHLVEKDAPEEQKDVENSDAMENTCKPTFFQFPLSVYFIICNEFCERFNYFGVRAILTLYLIHFVGLSDNDSTAVFHLFVVICYLTPLLGAIIADNCLGRFWTILSLSIVYCLGSVVLSSTSVPPYKLAGPLIGLVLIGFGTGGIKPNVSAFGADQIPQSKSKLIGSYFSVFYLSINLGSFFSLFLIPLVSSKTQCFGDKCYALAFGIPAIFMAVSIIIFLSGKPLYVMKKPSQSVLSRSITCIFNGITNYRKTELKEADKSFIDYADPVEYPPEFIQDVKCLAGLIVLYIPFPIFWALFDQMGSRWTIQASQMDGNIVAGWTLLPDQMQALNPLLLILFIPLFECCVYPIIDRCMQSHTLLKRLGLGMLIASFAFLAAMIVQFKIEEHLLPKITNDGNVRAVFVNTMSDCDVTMSYKSFSVKVARQSSSDTFHVPFDGKQFGGVTVDTADSCSSSLSPLTIDVPSAYSNKSFDIVLYADASKNMKLLSIPAKEEKHKKGLVMVRVMVTNSTFLSNLNKQFYNISFLNVHKERVSLNFTQDPKIDVSGSDVLVTPYLELPGAFYEVQLLPRKSSYHPVNLHSITLVSGEALTLSLYPPPEEKLTPHYQKVVEIWKNDVSMLWMIPQYILISVAEIFFSISGLTFSYAHAPASLKSVVQAIWLMCVGLGNIVVMIVSEVDIFPNQSYEFLMYALLMMLNVILFALIAMRYNKYHTPPAVPINATQELDLQEKKPETE